MKPKRIQLSRKSGWRMPPNTVKVDRTSPYGNPYRVSKGRVATHDGGDGLMWIVELANRVRIFPDKAEALKCSVELFKKSRVAELVRRAPNVLRGKNLACWCKLGSPCHADVLLEIANS